MANIRRLKKVIDIQIYSVISDCLTYSALHPGEKQHEADEIISDAVILRNELLHRCNNPEKNAGQNTGKRHYRSIITDLNDGVDKLFERLSSVLKKRTK